MHTQRIPAEQPTHYCIWCGRPMIGEHADSLYCTERCVRAAARAVPCAYCGQPATGHDHVEPRVFRVVMADVGEDRNRRLPDTVPACQECNSTGGPQVFNTVGEKRRYIHDRLRHKYAKLLNSPTWHEHEIDELGYELQTHIRSAERAKRVIRARLFWPRRADPLTGETGT